MARGREKHEAYQQALNLLGKDLARRARSRCELSEERGSLVIYDLEDSSVEPSLEHVIMVSPTVKEHLDGKNLEGNNTRYLENAVWSELPAVRRAAIRILEQVNEIWAREALDNARMMDSTMQEEEENW